MKVVAGLGNPGPEYEDTRHNVGWWVLDQVAFEWRFGPFRKGRCGLYADGVIAGRDVRLIRPITYMNRSGMALAPPAVPHDFDAAEDLLVVVDDATRDVGRIRIRPRGSPGGHNGLKSISDALDSDDYARLRVGVGVAPQGADLAQWVLSPMSPDDEETVETLLPELARAVEVWVRDGIEATMNGFNR
jgi:PTH1 family peptidyl-tRNA hydrolase